MKPSNQDLFDRILAGDHEAWAVLVDRYSLTVWRITGNYGFDHGLREDVSQTVWLKLFDHLDRVRDPARVVGWLAQVTRNECVTVLRRRSRLQFVDEYHDLSDENPAMSAGLERQDVESALAQAFADLDERCRELLTLSMADPPLTYDEISEITGMPRGSIGPTRGRCLEKLREHGSLEALDSKEQLP